MGNLPNFLVVGATRAGTSALYSYLEQHPQIYVPEIKEPGFFMLEGTTLKNPYSTTNFAIYDLDTYQSLFDGVEPHHIAVGEATTGYLSSEGVPQRIQHYSPDAKLFAILRNPIERAYSEWQLLVRAGREKLSFEEACRKEVMTPLTDLPWNPDEIKYIRKGMYYAHLKRFYDTFDASQITVFLHEEWLNDQQETLRTIFNTLGVDETFQGEEQMEHNVGGIPKNALAYKVVFGSDRVKKIGKMIIPTKRRKQIRKAFLNRSKEGLTPEIRRELVEVYRSDVESLEGLIGRDLSHWLHVE